MPFWDGCKRTANRVTIPITYRSNHNRSLATFLLETLVLQSDTVTDANRNDTLFDLHYIDRRDAWLHLRFTKRLERGVVPVDIDRNVSLNYATGKENRLTKHDR